MNAKDLKKIEAAISALDHQKVLMEQMKDGYNEDYDNMSEKSQDGERGQQLQSIIYALEEFEMAVDEAISKLEEARDA